MNQLQALASPHAHLSAGSAAGAVAGEPGAGPAAFGGRGLRRLRTAISYRHLAGVASPGAVVSALMVEATAPLPSSPQGAGGRAGAGLASPSSARSAASDLPPALASASAVSAFAGGAGGAGDAGFGAGSGASHSDSGRGSASGSKGSSKGNASYMPEETRVLWTGRRMEAVRLTANPLLIRQLFKR